MLDAVYSSLAIPGMFPSVADGNDRLLVDGVLENLPVSAMARRGESPVVAMDARGRAVGSGPRNASTSAMICDMRSPFLVVQLSDPHIGAEWADGDPIAGLTAVVECVRSLGLQPDAVLVSGDLTDHASDAEYERVRDLLAPLRAPVYVLPGNHDERVALRRNFGVPGTDAEPVCYSVDLGPWRLVVLDSTLPGEDPGALGHDRLAWLEAELDAEPEQLTLIAMHHPRSKPESRRGTTSASPTPAGKCSAT